MLPGLQICSCLLISVNRSSPALCTIPKLGEQLGQKVAMQVGIAGKAHHSPNVSPGSSATMCLCGANLGSVPDLPWCPPSPACGLGPMKCVRHTHTPPLPIPNPLNGLSCWHKCHLWELEKGEKPIGQGGACGLSAAEEKVMYGHHQSFLLEVTLSLFLRTEERAAAEC